MNKDLEEKYLNVIEDNVNVGKRNDGIEFLILITGVVGFCILLFFFADTISNIFIGNMSLKTQMKIEKTISVNSGGYKVQKSERIKKLEKIKSRIVSLDKNLKGKYDFPIYELKEKQINAFVYPNGSIYVTSGLLNKIHDEEMLTFVLAHEIGHYSHRDHLKSISRNIITSLIVYFLSAGQKDLNIAVSSISELTGLKYSRKQEREADIYGNKVVYILYGRNTGAIEFFKLLQKENSSPEFLHYFSTHPSIKERIKLLEKNKQTAINVL